MYSSRHRVTCRRQCAAGIAVVLDGEVYAASGRGITVDSYEYSMMLVPQHAMLLLGDDT